MVLGKRWLFSIGNGAEIQPLEIGRKSPVLLYRIKLSTIFEPKIVNTFLPFSFKYVLGAQKNHHDLIKTVPSFCLI